MHQQKYLSKSKKLQSYVWQEPLMSLSTLLTVDELAKRILKTWHMHLWSSRSAWSMFQASQEDYTLRSYLKRKQQQNTTKKLILL